MFISKQVYDGDTIKPGMLIAVKVMVDQYGRKQSHSSKTLKGFVVHVSDLKMAIIFYSKSEDECYEKLVIPIESVTNGEYEIIIPELRGQAYDYFANKGLL